MSGVRAWRPSPAMVVAIVALIAGVSGGATAATLITGAQIKDGSVTGKDIKNGSITRRDLAPGTARGTQGPQGQQGPQGFQGSQGPAGIQGPPGLRGLSGVLGAHRVSIVSAFDSTDEKTVVASCPLGEVVIGGGASVLPPVAAVTASAPDVALTNWTARANEIAPTLVPWDVKADVICAPTG